MDIKKAVDFMIKIANDDSHGYDQKNRNGKDYDCSSLVATALKHAGFNVSPYSWTGNLYEQLLNCGFIVCEKPWKAGDIHLNHNYHVNMSINEAQIVEASLNEFGGIVGGQTGDQTGEEIAIRNYYEYPYGWDVHLRYVGNSAKQTKIDIAKSVIMGEYGNGDDRKRRLEADGYDYNEIQTIVNDMLSETDLTRIALEVINGKWGNGSYRKNALEVAGYNYTKVQQKVNQLLGG